MFSNVILHKDIRKSRYYYPLLSLVPTPLHFSLSRFLSIIRSPFLSAHLSACLTALFFNIQQMATSVMNIFRFRFLIKSLPLDWISDYCIFFKVPFCYLSLFCHKIISLSWRAYISRLTNIFCGHECDCMTMFRTKSWIPIPHLGTWAVKWKKKILDRSRIKGRTHMEKNILVIGYKVRKFHFDPIIQALYEYIGICEQHV